MLIVNLEFGHLHILVMLTNVVYVADDKAGKRNMGKTRIALIFQFISIDLVVIIA